MRLIDSSSTLSFFEDFCSSSIVISVGGLKVSSFLFLSGY